MSRITSLSLLLALTLVFGCTEKTQTEPSTTVQAPSFVRTAAQPASDAPPAPPAPPAMRGVPIGTSKAPTPVEDDPSELAEEPEAEEKKPELPNVTVKNIGMHIGGGPNTNRAKRPIRDAVKPHYDDLLVCYAKAHKPRDKSTYGVDMRIPGEGGKAVISNPRTSLRGAGVRSCFLDAFKKVVFPKTPRGKTTMVSFSVRFTQND